MNRRSNKKMLIKYLIDLTITTIIVRIYFNDLINLVTLNTLNVFNILTDLRALNADQHPPKNINSPKESIEITKSKIIVLSIKNYLKPIPINFPKESIVNIIVKVELN